MIKNRKIRLKQLHCDLKYCLTNTNFGEKLSLWSKIKKNKKIIFKTVAGSIVTGSLLYILLKQQKKLEKEKQRAKTQEELLNIEKKEEILKLKIEEQQNLEQQKEKEQKNLEQQKEKEQQNLEQQKEKEQKLKTKIDYFSNEENIENRIKTSSIIKSYFKDINPCLLETDEKILYLENIKNIPLVFFNKRIGSESGNGVAYLNTGNLNFKDDLKFSSKLITKVSAKSGLELQILREMSELVLAKKTPNMPIIYLQLECNNRHTLKNFGELAFFTQFNNYVIIINELADQDLKVLVTKDQSILNYDIYISILMQTIISIYFFHKLGYLHKDIKLDNFLVHNVEPGGYWYYKINNENIFIKNLGYLIVIWDPIGKQIDENNFNDGISSDFEYLLNSFRRYIDYVKDDKTKIIINSMQEYINLNKIGLSKDSYNEYVLNLLKIINIQFNQSIENKLLINKKPYSF